MGMFLFGVLVGAVLGAIMMALCAAQRPEKPELEEMVKRISKMAQKANEEALRTDDALGQARAEGMWAATCEMRRYSDG